MNCRNVINASDEYWMLEASKELGVSVSEMIERNRPENNLYSMGIASVTDEISKAYTRKFLREHPNWQGFGSPDPPELLPWEQLLREQPNWKNFGSPAYLREQL